MILCNFIGDKILSFKILHMYNFLMVIHWKYVQWLNSQMN